MLEVGRGGQNMTVINTRNICFLKRQVLYNVLPFLLCPNINHANCSQPDNYHQQQINVSTLYPRPPWWQLIWEVVAFSAACTHMFAHMLGDVQTVRWTLSVRFVCNKQNTTRLLWDRHRSPVSITHPWACALHKLDAWLRAAEHLNMSIFFESMQILMCTNAFNR